jgi:Putative peptidoglycan binding domain/L,D-transpeptidase catalytic domain
MSSTASARCSAPSTACCAEDADLEVRRNVKTRARLLLALLVVVLGLGACGGDGKPAPGSAAPATTLAPSSTEAPSTTGAPTTTTAATTTTEAPTTTRATTTTTTRPAEPEEPRVLRAGMRGDDVAALQHRLGSLGYEVTSADGSFGEATRHAVVAFQKVNGLDRDGAVGPRTRKALERPRIPRPRSGGAGMHLEVDLTHQVVMVVRGGRVAEILDSSTASGRTYTVDGDVRVARTPIGSFRVQRKLDGWRKSDLGLLWRPAYFFGGYAVHGSPSVPPFPASHGCVRVTMASMNRLAPRLPIGTPVLVYRS